MTEIKCIVAGNRIHATCPDCGKFIRLNKPVLGSLHVCIGEEDRTRHRRITQPTDDYLETLMTIQKNFRSAPDCTNPANHSLGGAHDPSCYPNSVWWKS